MRKAYKTVQKEIWIANNGREFCNEDDCLKYEDELDKIEDALDKMEVLKDVIPHGFSPYEDIHYTWYRVASDEDVKIINDEMIADLCGLNEIDIFPEYVCVETDYDGDKRSDTTLTKLMNEYKEFLKSFGIEVVYKTEV